MGNASSKNPELGDLIEIIRGRCEHWAVYVGDGHVVHLTAAPGFLLYSPLNKKALVKKEKLQDVFGRNNWKINNILDKECRPRPVLDIVREACALVGKKLPHGIIRGNSKRFATELRYSRKRSWLSKNPEPGDLIEIFRDTYQHWAVYVGDGDVVHLTTAFGCSSGSLSSNPGANGLVMKEKLQDVVGTDDWTVNNILDKNCSPRPVDVIVNEACARKDKVLPYDIATRNCEHFATELRYGEPESLQVFKAFYLSVRNPLGLATAMAVDAIAHRVLKLPSSMSRNKKKRRQSHTLMQSPASPPQRG